MVFVPSSSHKNQYVVELTLEPKQGLPLCCQGGPVKLTSLPDTTQGWSHSRPGGVPTTPMRVGCQYLHPTQQSGTNRACRRQSRLAPLSAWSIFIVDISSCAAAKTSCRVVPGGRCPFGGDGAVYLLCGDPTRLLLHGTACLLEFRQTGNLEA